MSGDWSSDVCSSDLPDMLLATPSPQDLPYEWPDGPDPYKHLPAEPTPSLATQQGHRQG